MQNKYFPYFFLVLGCSTFRLMIDDEDDLSLAFRVFNLRPSRFTKLKVNNNNIGFEVDISRLSSEAFLKPLKLRASPSRQSDRVSDHITQPPSRDGRTRIITSKNLRLYRYILHYWQEHADASMFK